MANHYESIFQFLICTLILNLFCLEFYGRPEFKSLSVFCYEFLHTISVGNDLTVINLLLSFQNCYGI